MNLNKAKTKMIVSKIESKMNSWISTLPLPLQLKVSNSYIVTGGAIASMLLDEEPKDYDVYFSDVQVCKELANHYVKQFQNKTSKQTSVNIIGNSNSVKIEMMTGMEPGIRTPISMQPKFENFIGDPSDLKKNHPQNSYIPLLITANAITLSDDLQIITRFVGNAEFIHSNFDFLHAMNYFSQEAKLQLTNISLECIREKQLKYCNSQFPIAAIIRLKKFIKRGWNINAGEIFKICWDIAHLNLDDPETLKNQITGFYGREFISLLNEMDQLNYEMTREKLANIVSRLFD